MPTGTVLLSTTTVYLFIARPTSRATLEDVLQIRRAVFRLWRPDRDEHHLGSPHGRGQVRREAQSLFVTVTLDDFFESRLVDRHPAGVQGLDLRLVLIDADDSAAVFRQAGSDHEPDVPGSHDGDFHFTIRY